MIRSYLGDTSQWDLFFNELVCCSTKLGDLILIEDMDPTLRVVGVVLGLPYTLASDFLWEF